MVSAARSADDSSDDDDDDNNECDGTSNGNFLAPQSQLARMAASLLKGAAVTYKDYPKEERPPSSSSVTTQSTPPGARRSFFTIVTVATETPHVSDQVAILIL